MSDSKSNAIDQKRRTILKGIGAGAAVGALGGAGLVPQVARAASSVKAKTPIKIGYLHTLAVDGQMWLADHMGTWAKQGLDPQFLEFTTGLQLFQAMIGGSIDVLATGAVISNFPARGHGQAFLINDVEYATAQLWVHPDMGIHSIQDLKGKKIATTVGTTANVFLYWALKKAGLSEDDVTIVNEQMGDAVTTFIAGHVAAVALWVPFNIPVEKHAPGAKMLMDASKFYPEAAIVDGWAARNDFFKDKPEVLDKIIKAWIPANDFLVAEPDKALKIIQEKHYSKVPLDKLTNQYHAEKVFTSQEWLSKYKDGTVTGWLQQVTDFFVDTGIIKNAVPAKKYFHPQSYIDIVG